MRIIYKVESVTDKELEDLLGKMENAGWTFVQIVFMPPSKYKVIFKRMTG